MYLKTFGIAKLQSAPGAETHATIIIVRYWAAKFLYRIAQ